MQESILEREYSPSAERQNTFVKADTVSPPAIGLTTEQAEQLRCRYGPNVLAEEKKARPLKIFLGQFKDIMVLILLAATLISVFLGETTDAVTIGIIVALNAVLGFVQEYRTEKTLLALKNMSAPTAKAYRDGHMTVIPAAELVPGDVVSLEAGDRIPADCAIIKCRGAMAEESILTGESVPVGKTSGNPFDSDNSIGKPNILYSGTVLVKGTAEARVAAVGKSAQIGKISDMLGEIDEELTPLQKRLGELGKIIAVICLAVCIIVAGAGILRGEPVFDMLMTGITIAIAAIPEGLPATVTIALALAVGRMLKQNALVHKLHSVETLGCTSVICTDKTGTITENKMTVCKAYTGRGEYCEFSGTGYRIGGNAEKNGKPFVYSDSPSFEEMLRCACLCSNADISKKNGEWKTAGDPTEAALLIAADKGGISHTEQRKAYLRLDEIPFDSTDKTMTVICRSPKGEKTAYVKGACDVLLARCSHMLTDSGKQPLTASMRRSITAECEKMSDEALRVLALAYKTDDIQNCRKGLVFLGMMAMSDPPREEAKRAVRLCRESKIRTVMITGDHKNTAAAVARQAGILTGDGLVVTGSELEAMTDEQLCAVAERTSVFARVSPEDKLRIVRAYKKNKEIVTMTGDGVNDAPAVKEADIGVAMGLTGTDVTRQAADMVLLDDNFATLVKAVEQGRGIYANIRKFVRYLLSCNIGEVLTMFLGIIMGMPMVLLPAQILLVNLVTDGLPAVALGVEPTDPACMKRPPRRSDESFFSGGLMSKIVFRGILIGLCSLASFTLMLRLSGGLETARTGALLTLVMSQLFHVFECKSEEKNLFTVPYLNNPQLIISVLISALVIFAAIYLPFMQPIFSTVALNGRQLACALLLSLTPPLLQAVFSKN